MGRVRFGLVLVALWSAGGAVGDGGWAASTPSRCEPSPSHQEGRPASAGRRPFAIPRGLDLYMPVPASNPVTAEKIALGRRLFFETRLSADGSTACASCHDPARAFTDGRPIARGIGGRMGTRNAPTLVNRGYGARHFLDGRADTLEEQVLQPIDDPNELGRAVSAVVRTLGDDAAYRRLFAEAFGREPDANGLAHALASYVRSILSGDSAFDRYQAGDRAALTDEQQAGLQIFLGKGRCSACHVGPNLTDEEFHNTGVAWAVGTGPDIPEATGAYRDVGRFGVTGRPDDLGAFKTPTLRDIARTAPYMHDGSLETLDAVVDFYDGGGASNPHLDRRIGPLRLTESEKGALVSFLASLSGVVRHGGG